MNRRTSRRFSGVAGLATGIVRPVTVAFLPPRIRAPVPSLHRPHLGARGPRSTTACAGKRRCLPLKVAFVITPRPSREGTRCRYCRSRSSSLRSLSRPLPSATASLYGESAPRAAGAGCRTRRYAGEGPTGSGGGAGWQADLPEANRYHSGCQGTYSRTSPSLLDCLARSRNTESTCSFWSSSLAVVFVPSHSDSIQRTVLVLAPVVAPSTSLTSRPLIRSHEQPTNSRYQTSTPGAPMHAIRHVADNDVAAQDVGVSGLRQPSVPARPWSYRPPGARNRWGRAT